jgi:uncharacterized RDD family membrane protein YckC
MDEYAQPENGPRFLANLIDGLLMAALGFGFGMAMAMVSPSAARDLEFGMRFGMIGLAVLYGAVMESSSWQGTVGKRVMGLIVVNEQGQRLNLGQAFGRSAAKQISLTMCGLIALGILRDEARRGVWDRVAGTRVVQRPHHMR